MGGLNDRKIYTDDKTKQFKSLLGNASKLCEGKACVYAIGSFGRVEASEHSDLDLYIVGKDDGAGGSMLKPLDEICVKADLISAIRKLNLPEFDGDGRYLVHYPVGSLISSIGEPDDDSSNTFTSRLLLLLESQCLIDEGVHRQSIESIIHAYWRDFADHKDDFIPAYLANDILRLWRTFCVNYEARTKTQPEEKKAKRKVKNFKLKHSRILTCYSALLYLLGIYAGKGTVEPADAISMSYLTPIDRLNWLLQQEEFNVAHDLIEKLLDQYERFLDITNVQEAVLVQKVLDKTIGKEFFATSYEFGETMFGAISAVGQGNKFHRLIVV